MLNIFDLNEDELLKLVSFLDFPSYINFSKTCRRFNHLLMEPSAKKHLKKLLIHYLMDTLHRILAYEENQSQVKLKFFLEMMVKYLRQMARMLCTLKHDNFANNVVVKELLLKCVNSSTSGWDMLYGFELKMDCWFCFDLGLFRHVFLIKSVNLGKSMVYGMIRNGKSNSWQCFGWKQQTYIASSGSYRIVLNDTCTAIVSGNRQILLPIVEELMNLFPAEKKQLITVDALLALLGFEETLISRVQELSDVNIKCFGDSVKSTFRNSFYAIPKDKRYDLDELFEYLLAYGDMESLNNYADIMTNTNCIMKCFFNIYMQHQLHPSQLLPLLKSLSVCDCLFTESKETFVFCFNGGIQVTLSRNLDWPCEHVLTINDVTVLRLECVQHMENAGWCGVISSYISGEVMPEVAQLKSLYEDAIRIGEKRSMFAITAEFLSLFYADLTSSEYERLEVGYSDWLKLLKGHI